MEFYAPMAGDLAMCSLSDFCDHLIPRRQELGYSSDRMGEKRSLRYPTLFSLSQTVKGIFALEAMEAKTMMDCVNKYARLGNIIVTCYRKLNVSKTPNYGPTVAPTNDSKKEKCGKMPQSKS